MHIDSLIIILPLIAVLGALGLILIFLHYGKIGQRLFPLKKLLGSPTFSEKKPFSKRSPIISSPFPASPQKKDYTNLKHSQGGNMGSILKECSEDYSLLTVRENSSPIEKETKKVYSQTHIVMHLFSAPETEYTGHDLFRIFKNLNLQLGNMNIFHRYDGLSDSVLFSIASAIEPGIFDPSLPASKNYRGICAFILLKKTTDPSKSLELMLASLREIENQLGGNLCDEHRLPLTEEMINHYRLLISSVPIN